MVLALVSCWPKCKERFRLLSASRFPTCLLRLCCPLLLQPAVRTAGAKCFLYEEISFRCSCGHCRWWPQGVQASCLRSTSRFLQRATSTSAFWTTCRSGITLRSLETPDTLTTRWSWLALKTWMESRQRLTERGCTKMWLGNEKKQCVYGFSLFSQELCQRAA